MFMARHGARPIAGGIARRLRRCPAAGAAGPRPGSARWHRGTACARSRPRSPASISQRDGLGLSPGCPSTSVGSLLPYPCGSRPAGAPARSASRACCSKLSAIARHQRIGPALAERALVLGRNRPRTGRRAPSPFPLKRPCVVHGPVSGSATLRGTSGRQEPSPSADPHRGKTSGRARRAPSTFPLKRPCVVHGPAGSAMLPRHVRAPGTVAICRHTSRQNLGDGRRRRARFR
jgi:hypothetical protein